MDRDESIIFGINAILEKLRASPEEIVEILVAGAAAARVIESAAKRSGHRVTYAKGAFLDHLALGQRHQGAVARVAAYHYWELDDLVAGSALTSSPQRLLILDGVTDPRNFGALLRCADGAGAPHVIIPKDRSVSVTPTVVKASAGAAHHVKVYRVTNLRQTMQRLKRSGFWLVGLEARANDRIYDLKYPEKLGIVLGGEGRGLRPLVRRECDFLVSIPMSGKVASLNVAVAGAVFLYEVMRRTPVESVDKGGINS